VSRRAALALLLALALAPGCATLAGLEPPDVHVANLVPLDATLFEQSVRVDLRLHNANDAALAIRGVRFVLRVNDEVLARGASGEPVTIPRLSDGLISVEARSSSIALLRQVLAAPADGVFRYELEGDVLLDRLLPRTLGFRRSGSVAIPLEPAPRSAPLSPPAAVRE
jgi:LEA14-like dessication related protein